jgi:O-antigen ligase
MTFRGIFVGAYLFSVPVFSYSESMGLVIIPQIRGVLLVAYAIFDMLRTKSIKIPFEIQLYGLLGLWAATTFIFGESTSDLRPLGTLIKVVIVTLACAQLINDETDLFTALKIFVVSIPIVYYLNIDDLQSLSLVSQVAEDDRFAGTLTNANTAAIFSLTIIWASIFLLLLSKKSLLRKALFFIPIGFSLLIIKYSGSKKGLIGISLFVLFFARLLYIRQHASFYKKSLVILVSISLIVVTVYFIYTSPFFYRIEEILDGGSISDIKRLELANEAINVWLMNWKTFFMGVGYDNFRLFSAMQTYSHSTPFELLASNGIIGFFLFVAFLALLFYKFLYLYRHALNQEFKTIFFSALIFLFLYSFFLVAAILHDSRELMPILGCLAAFGQYHLLLLRQSRINGTPNSVL